MAEHLKILLAGMVAGNHHQGGASWAVLQYVAGLESLGHEVLLVEPVSASVLDDRLVVDYFRSLPLSERRAALLAQPGRRTLGLPYDEVLAFAVRADLLLNISGMLRDERLLESIDVRAFLDLDPGFNQVWHAEGEDMGFDLHTHFVTVGSLVGKPGCPIPTCGRDWIGILPPVALAHWPVQSERPSREAFTTVGHWRSYGSVEHAGLHYGQRAHSLRQLIDLPRQVEERFELALGIDVGEQRDIEALAANGWHLLDPSRAAGTPSAYREFVSSSKAELCVAKSGYVASRSGWFSDRSACYLASGRPVVAQETGFAQSLPTGEGLLAFASTEEAAESVAEVSAHPARHGPAARAIAEEHLDASRVLRRLLHELGRTG
ncbi:MAG TPA: hypothetical protein VG366_00245 [Solirubrobacteraceae bacterium]|jgi:hypothetical protein|nr:hypothetical protein [Solirubrobacteraceae bacterium]